MMKMLKMENELSDLNANFKINEGLLLYKKMVRCDVWWPYFS